MDLFPREGRFVGDSLDHWFPRPSFLLSRSSTCARDHIDCSALCGYAFILCFFFLGLNNYGPYRVSPIAPHTISNIHHHPIHPSTSTENKSQSTIQQHVYYYHHPSSFGQDPYRLTHYR